jgi:lipoyl(octanoyl) transferase
MYKCEVRELGRIGYSQGFEIQQQLVEQRKQGIIPDQLLLLEHPHSITLCRNGRLENLLGSEPVLRAAGIAFHQSDRGGDITYHGPGQAVGYPILDLREWKRDVGAYVRAIEQVMIDVLADFGIAAGRLGGCTGAWVDGEKIGAIGVHISRWVTSHGFALNVSTDLSYFGYIVPCGLAKPVTSMSRLGVDATLPEVNAKLAEAFGRVFDREILGKGFALEIPAGFGSQESGVRSQKLC